MDDLLNFNAISDPYSGIGDFKKQSWCESTLGGSRSACLPHDLIGSVYIVETQSSVNLLDTWSILFQAP